MGDSQRVFMDSGSVTFLPSLSEHYKNTALLLYYSERDGEKVEETPVHGLTSAGAWAAAIGHFGSL